MRALSKQRAVIDDRDSIAKMGETVGGSETGGAPYQESRRTGR